MSSTCQSRSSKRHDFYGIQSESARMFGGSTLMSDSNKLNMSKEKLLDDSTKSDGDGVNGGERAATGGGEKNPFDGDDDDDDGSSKEGEHLETGEDTAQQGGTSPSSSNNNNTNTQADAAASSNRVGPFYNNNSTSNDDNPFNNESDNESDDRNEEEEGGGPLTPQDIEEWHESCTSHQSNHGGSSVRLLGGSSSSSVGSNNSHRRKDSPGGGGGVVEEGGAMLTSNSNDNNDDDEQRGELTPHSAETSTTNNNNDDNNNDKSTTTNEKKKGYYNLSKPEECSKFMTVATGTGVQPGEDIGNGNAAIGLNDAGLIYSPPMETITMEGEEGGSLLYSNEKEEEEEEEGEMNIKTHRTRSSIRYNKGDSPLSNNNQDVTLPADGNDAFNQDGQQQQRRRSSDIGSSSSSLFKSFSGGSNNKNGNNTSSSLSNNNNNNNNNNNGEDEKKYASMQELLDDEKSRSTHQFDDELGIHHRRRQRCCAFGGCTSGSCCTVCGTKSTKRRTICCLLLLLLILGGIVAGILVYFLILVPQSNNTDIADSTNNNNEEKNDRPEREPAFGPTVPSNNSTNNDVVEEEDFNGLDLVFKFTPLPSLSVVPTPSSVIPTSSPSPDDDNDGGGNIVTPTISPIDNNSTFIMINNSDGSNIVSSTTISNSPSNYATSSSSLLEDDSLNTTIVNDDLVGNDGIDLTFDISNGTAPTTNSSTNNSSSAGGETTTNKLVISIPGNLTLNINNTNTNNDTNTNDINNINEMSIDKRNTFISILQTTIRDVIETNNNNSNNELLVNNVNGEVAVVKDVVILSINGEDVILILPRHNRQQRRMLSSTSAANRLRQLLRGTQQKRELQTSTPPSIMMATLTVEYELILEETCIAITTCSSQSSINTTQSHYETNVIEYLQESINNGSFTNALHDNVDEIQSMVVADSFVNTTTTINDANGSEINAADNDNESAAVISLLQNAQVVNGTFSTVRVVVETTTSTTDEDDDDDDDDDDDIGASQDDNTTLPIMPSLDNVTDHHITLSPTISSMPTVPTTSPLPTNIVTSSSSSITTPSLAPSSSSSSNATIFTNSSENTANNETHSTIINVTTTNSSSSLVGSTTSPTISSSIPTQLPSSSSPTLLDESLSMIPTSEMTTNSSSFSSLEPISNVPTLSPEPSVLVSTNGTTITMLSDDDNVGLDNNNNATSITNETLPSSSSDGLNITKNETTIDSPLISSLVTNNNTMNETTAATTTTNDVSTAVVTTTLNDLSFPYTLSLSITSEIPLSRYGSSVTISNDGKYVVISAKDGTNENGVDVGVVYIYSMMGRDDESSEEQEEGGGSLTLLQVLYGKSSQDEYGNSIALSNNGQRLVVGSRSENEQMGVVRIYQLDDNNATLMEGGIIKGEYPSERAGWSVSISSDGNVVAIGAPKGGSTGGGSVRTFKYKNSDDTASTTGGSWEPYGSVIEGGLQSSKEAAGYSVSLDDTGSIMAVGFPKAINEDKGSLSNAGKTAIYVMNNETSNWEIVGQEIYGEEENTIDGGSVAISDDGTILVVGGKGKSYVNETTGDILTSVGQCRIYEYHQTSSPTDDEPTTTQWVLKDSILGQVSNERLGTWVSVSSDGNIVGCGGVGGMYNSNDDDSSSSGSSSTSGVVRLYNLQESQESTIWPRGGGEGNVDKATFGSSVAISNDGEYIVVGAPTWSSTNTKEGFLAGAVQVFGLMHEDEIVAVVDKEEEEEEEEEVSTTLAIGVVDDEMGMSENTLAAFANDRSI